VWSWLEQSGLQPWIMNIWYHTRERSRKTFYDVIVSTVLEWCASRLRNLRSQCDDNTAYVLSPPVFLTAITLSTVLRRSWLRTSSSCDWCINARMTSCLCVVVITLLTTWYVVFTARMRSAKLPHPSVVAFPFVCKWVCSRNSLTSYRIPCVSRPRNAPVADLKK